MSSGWQKPCGSDEAEEWRPIPDFDCYEASSLGRVRSRTRTIKGDHHGAFVQHSLQPDGGTVRIHQNEVFDLISFLHRSRADAAASELVCCAVHDFELFGRQDVIPIVIASFIELACRL